MNPQPDISGYFPSAYPMNNANRSPSSSRPGYNTAVGLTGVSRMTQRQMEAIGQPSAALFAADDRFNSYDNAAFRHNRLQPAAAFATDSFIGNNQAWAYNAGANTVNGALGDNRVRNGGRRALPTVRFIFMSTAHPAPSPPPFSPCPFILLLSSLPVIHVRCIFADRGSVTCF